MYKQSEDDKFSFANLIINIILYSGILQKLKEGSFTYYGISKTDFR